MGVAGVVAVSSSEEEEEEVMAAGKMEGFDGRMPSWFYTWIAGLVVYIEAVMIMFSTATMFYVRYCYVAHSMVSSCSCAFIDCSTIANELECVVLNFRFKNACTVRTSYYRSYRTTEWSAKVGRFPLSNLVGTENETLFCCIKYINKLIMIRPKKRSLSNQAVWAIIMDL